MPLGRLPNGTVAITSLLAASRTLRSPEASLVTQMETGGFLPLGVGPLLPPGQINMKARIVTEKQHGLIETRQGIFRSLCGICRLRLIGSRLLIKTKLDSRWLPHTPLLRKASGRFPV